MSKRLVMVGALIVALMLAACSSAPLSSTGTKVNVAGGSYNNVNSTTLKQMLNAKDFVFINVHIPYEGELAQTDAFVPYDQIEQNLAKFPTDKQAKIVLYCRSGHMSAIAAETLIRHGYSNIYNLDGGMAAWGNEGLPIIRK